MGEVPMSTQLRRHGHHFSRGLAFLCFGWLRVWAQLYTGSLAGVVLDPSNAPVMGAKVTLLDSDRSTRTGAETDGSGRYLFRSLPPGDYSLQVEAAGFEPFNLSVAVDVNASLSVEARLQLSSRRDSIQVHLRQECHRPPARRMETPPARRASSQTLSPTEAGTPRRTCCWMVSAS